MVMGIWFSSYPGFFWTFFQQTVILFDSLIILSLISIVIHNFQIYFSSERTIATVCQSLEIYSEYDLYTEQLSLIISDHYCRNLGWVTNFRYPGRDTNL